MFPAWVPSMTLPRQLLRALALGATWVCLWAAFGAARAIVVGIVDPPSIDPGEGPIDVARILGIAGGACGFTCGLLLAIAEPNRPLATVPLLRAGLWGAIAGTALPLLTPWNDAVVANTAPLSALSAVACAVFARVGGVTTSRAAPTRRC